jgi:hypothetical protein
MKMWAPVLTVLLLVLGLVAPAAASAQASHRNARVVVHGGTSSVTTAAGLVTKLLGAKIVAFATSPGTASLITPSSGPRLVAKFPVTGGNVSAGPPRGTIRHSGGLLLTNLNNNKAVQVDRFVIDITHRVLTAHVVGTTLRLTVFDLNLKRAVLTVKPHIITISRVGLALAAGAATALNGALGTTVFKSGMAFGTASSRLRR